MIDRLIEVIYWFFYISIELSILFLGISFLIGLVTTYIQPKKVETILSRYGKGIFGNALGALFGGLLPFCSCSTIPALIGLLKVGVPFGIAMSFLIASPIGVFNIAVISLFSVLFGWKTAILYVTFTFVLAVISGWIFDKLGLKQYLKKVKVVGASEENLSYVATGSTLWERTKPKISSSWIFTKNLYRQMVPYILIGVGIGAMVYGFVPEDFLATYAGPSNPFAVILAAAIGIPMYVRTETMIPICYVLFEKGVGLGTLMALIIGGAGASIAELTLLASLFKRKLLVAYIAAILIIAATTGYIFNYLSAFLF